MKLTGLCVNLWNSLVKFNLFIHINLLSLYKILFLKLIVLHLLNSWFFFIYNRFQQIQLISCFQVSSLFQWFHLISEMQSNISFLKVCLKNHNHCSILYYELTKNISSLVCSLFWLIQWWFILLFSLEARLSKTENLSQASMPLIIKVSIRYGLIYILKYYHRAIKCFSLLDFRGIWSGDVREILIVLICGITHWCDRNFHERKYKSGGVMVILYQNGFFHIYSHQSAFPM